MEKKEIKIENKREAEIFMLGRMKGLNDCCIRFWGIGYDKDETAREIRNFTRENICEITDTLKLNYILDVCYSDVEDFVKNHLTDN